MKIKLIVIYTLLALPFFAFGQKKKKDEGIDENKVYKYEMIRNDPEGARNLRIGVAPVIVDINNNNIWFGGGFDGAFRLNNKFEIDLNYQRAYLHTQDDSYNQSALHGFSIYETTKTNSFTGIAKIVFKGGVSETKESVHLKSVGNVEYRALIPANRLELFAARLGYTTGYEFIADEDIMFKGYRLDDPSQTVTEFGGLGFSNMMKYSMISIGASRLRISDVEVRFEEFKRNKSVEASTELYADILFAPKLELDPMLVPLTWDGSAGNWLDYRQFNVTDNTPKSKIGARIGIQENVISGFNWYYAAELGIRPGIKAPSGVNGYLSIKVGMLFSTHVD